MIDHLIVFCECFLVIKIIWVVMVTLYLLDKLDKLYLYPALIFQP